MKKSLFLLYTFLFMFLFLNFFSNEVNAKEVISKNYLFGNLNNDMHLEYINDDTQYLFFSTDHGIYLVNPETFNVEKYIKIDADISDYIIIDNIEDENKSNKDLVVFTNGDNYPSVIVYSLDSLEKIWSFTTFTTGYNNESIKIEKKIPIFDYEINKENILLVAGYKLYNLDIKTGKKNWDYVYKDNIWAVSFMGDVNNDKNTDIAISVQPSYIIGINGKNGQELWRNKIAKPYQVKRDEKVLGSAQRNVWDLTYLNSKLIATGEDGYIYQINPVNGHVIKESNILDNFPNILAFQIYLEGNNVKDFSSLSTNGYSSYKIINTRKTIDSNDDNINDLVVTVFESNTYAQFTGLTPRIYLIDGNTLQIIWQKQFDGKKLLDLNLNSNGDLSFYDGRDINIFNVKTDENVKNVLINTNSNGKQNNEVNSLHPLLFNNSLIINYDGIVKLDITDESNPMVISSLEYFNGYDTIVENNIYKLYYSFDDENNSIKNYQAIECTNNEGEVLWIYDLNSDPDVEDLYFNKFLINYINNKEEFIIINNLGELYQIGFSNEIEVNSYPLIDDNKESEGESSSEKVNVITNCPDFNNDGIEDIFVVFDDGTFIILNSANYNEVIFNDNLNSIINVENQHFNYAFPIFNDDKKQMYVISNNIVEIITLDNLFNTTIEKEESLGNYNFWDDGQSIKNDIDIDNDGHKDFVLRLNSNEENKALILNSSKGILGSITTGWDFTIYSTNEDLNNDGEYEIIVTTSNEDNEGNWQNVCYIVNPYTNFNNDDILFSKVFYEGNDFTNNSKYKPLEIINDITDDGIKDVLVLVDRWGDSYIQIYNINDDKKIKKVIPINNRFTEKEDMINLKIGAPGGFIDTFSLDNNNYMFLTFSYQQNQYLTSLLNINDFNNFQNVANLKGRIYNYFINDNSIIYNIFTNKNEDIFESNILDLNNKIKLLNNDENTVYNTSKINFSWEKNQSAINYKIYLDGRLIKITSKEDVNVYLRDGVNNIGIGVVLEDGTEIISNFNIKVDLSNSTNNTFYVYTGITLLIILILPIKLFRYRKRGN